MLKENVKMIKEMRKAVMGNLKNGCLDNATLEFAQTVLMYDEIEQKYNDDNANKKDK